MQPLQKLGPRAFTSSRMAHEAIRPTYIANTEIEGTAQEKKLYSLIWKRTVASQMEDASLMNTQIKVSSNCRPEKFNIQAAEVLFDGFLKLYMESQDDEEKILLKNSVQSMKTFLLFLGTAITKIFLKNLRLRISV